MRCDPSLLSSDLFSTPAPLRGGVWKSAISPSPQAARKDLCLTSTHTRDEREAHSKLLTLAISKGRELKLFGPSPGQNHWPKPDDAYDFREAQHAAFRYEFKHLEMTIIASVNDGAHGALSIHVICNPTAAGRQMLGSIDIEASDGDATAFGRLERNNGLYLRDLASEDGDYLGNDVATARLSTLQIERLGPFIR